MQTIFEDEDKKSNLRRVDTIDIIIYTGRVNRCMKEKYIRRFRIGKNRTWISREVFVRIKQRERTIKKFIQEFRKVVRESRYQEKVLVEEFKREMNEVIRRKLVEVERPPTSIKQWYECATNLDRY